MRSFMGAAGRISLSILLALTLCPALSLEAFADEEPVREEAVQGGAAVQADPNPTSQGAASSAEDDSALPKADNLDSQQPITDLAEPSSAFEPTPAANAIPMAEEDLDWQPCGTCEWAIDSSKTLIVRPANGAESGELEDWNSGFAPWRSSQVTAVRFEGSVIALTARGLFYNLSSLRSVDFSGLDLSRVDDASYMFYGCRSLESIDISQLDISNIIYMGNAFAHCTSMKSLTMANHPAAKVTSIGSILQQCSSLEFLDISGIDTSNLTHFTNLFQGCSSLTAIDTTSIDTSHAKDTSGMFSGCSSLTSLDLSTFSTSNVEDMSNMFYNCSSLTSLDLSSFDTSNVLDMQGMFSGCTSLTSLDLSSINTTHAIEKWGMFNRCTALTSVQVGTGFSFEETGGLSEDYWLSSANGVAYEGANLPSGIMATYSKFDIGAYNQVYRCGSCEWFIDDSRNLFVRPADGAQEGELTDWGYSPPWKDLKIISVTFDGVVYPLTAYGMFSGCTSLESVDLSGLKLSKTRDTSLMFANCSSLKTLDLSGIDMQQVIDAFRMFELCSELEAIDMSEVDATSMIDLSYMFYECTSLESLDLSGLKTKAIDDASYMFSGCRSLTSLNVSDLRMSDTCNMKSMFSSCASLESLTLFPLEPSDDHNLSSMFASCESLESLDLTEIKMTGFENASYMFSSCMSLSSITVGDQFYFEETGGLPAQYWQSNVDGIAYDGEIVPSAVSATYIKIDNSLIDQLYRNGGCLWSVDSSHRLSVRPASHEERGELGNVSWGAMPITSAVFEEGVVITDAYGMFRNCSLLETADLSSAEFSSVDNLSYMFSGCRSLSSFEFPISDYSHLTNIEHIFQFCVSLEDVDLANLNKAPLEDISYAFSNCSSLRYIDLSPLDTSNVTTMEHLLSSCVELETAGLSGLNTANVQNMAYMFDNCSSLQSLDLSSFDTSKAQNMTQMLGHSCNESILITLGDKFSFEGASWNRLLHFPSIEEKDYPDRSITGEWINVETGDAYSPEEIPSNSQATYSPEVIYHLAGNVVVSGDPCPGKALLASVEPTEAISSLEPRLLFQWFDGTTNEPLTETSESALFALPSEYVGRMLYCIVTTNSHGLDGSIKSNTVEASHNPKDSWLYNKMEHWQECQDCGCLLNASEHQFGEWKITLAATCYDDGQETRTCNVCGNAQTRAVPALGHIASDVWSSDELQHWHACLECGAALDEEGHSFGAWSVAQPPTCAEPGSESRSCSACGYAQTRSVPASGHSYGDAWSSDPSGHWRACAVCGAEEEAAAHEFGAWTATVPATCEEAGTESRACATCGYEESRAVPPLGHTAAQGWTSDASGHWHACLECGAALDEEGHSFGAWSVAQPPTCAEPGSESRSCSACGYAQTRSVPASGHSYGDAWSSDPSGHWRACAVCGAEEEAAAHEFGAWTATVPATCTSFGQEERMCSVCGFREIGEIPSTGHDILEGWRSDGTLHWKACSKCDERLDLDAHSFGDWQIDKPPTCTEAGEESQTCAVCGYEAVDPVEPTGHAWGSLLSDGSGHWRKCSSCGAKEPTSDHSFGEWTAVREPTVDAPGSEERCCSECGYCEQREIPAVEPSNPFVDVVEDSTPHYDHILWLAHEGISEGWDVGDGRREFRPYANVARADMAAFLYRLAGSPAYEPSAADLAAFSDVNGSTPHYKEVLWLASAGISEGWDVGDGKREFRPYESIARSDMAAFLHRLAIWMGAPDPGSEGRTFSDVGASIAHAEDVAWLSAAGITTGFPDGTFRPYDSIVRCDMAAFLHRLDGFVGGYEVD